MRAKLQKYGGDVFEPHELLEMLLYFSIPQKNTNPTAHALIDHQSCLQLLESDTDQMQQADGVGPSSALLIKMAGIFSRRAILEAFSRDPLENTFQRSMYLYMWYRGKPASTVTALLLDGEDRVIENAVLSQGRYIRPESYGDLILSFAGQRGASGVILAHNHANNVRDFCGGYFSDRADPKNAAGYSLRLSGALYCNQNRLLYVFRCLKQGPYPSNA